MTIEKDTISETSIPKKLLSVKVLGVGGAGCNVIDHLASQPPSGLSFAVLNTDAAALERSAVETRLLLGAKSTRGRRAGGDPGQGQAAAEEDLARIRELCQGADMVFVVAGLGGGTGTGAGPVVARVARELGALVLGVAILPFDFEGMRRQRQAHLGLEELKGAADGVVCLPNQKVFKLMDENTTVPQAFQILNELLAQGMLGIWRLLSRPGLINVDFASLCAVTQGKHSESSFAVVEAKGENRAREVIERLLAHPLIEGGQTLAEASEVLVSIAGGPDLAMADVNRIMEQINRQCEQAHLTMGAAVDEDLRDRLLVTLVASRRPNRTETPAPAPQVQSRRTDQPAPAFGDLSRFENPTDPSGDPDRPSRFVAPPPPLTPEKREQLLTQQATGGARQRKNAARLRQGQLALDLVSRGRFQKSEPTIHHGEDLDVPTYIRRGVALN